MDKLFEYLAARAAEVAAGLPAGTSVTTVVTATVPAGGKGLDILVDVKYREAPTPPPPAAK